MKTRIKMVDASHINEGQEQRINNVIIHLEQNKGAEITSVQTHFLAGCGYSAVITYTIKED